MNLRRRIALLIDPDLAALAYGERPLWWAGNDNREAMREIARTLSSIERRIGQRRPRIVECKHPELHGIDLEALGFTQGKTAC